MPSGRMVVIDVSEDSTVFIFSQQSKKECLGPDDGGSTLLRNFGYYLQPSNMLLILHFLWKIKIETCHVL